MLPSQHAYAALLLKQDHVAEAADVYAEDLSLSYKLIGPHRHLNNVWALHGYHECMTRLGHITEAQMIQVPLKVAMAVADIPIQSSCFCRLETANKKSSRGGSSECFVFSLIMYSCMAIFMKSIQTNHFCCILLH